jgi:hypothetical protein
MTTKKVEVETVTKDSQIKVPKNLHDRFNVYREKHGLNVGDAFALLLEQTVLVNLSEHDREKIHAAAKQANTTFESVCIAGALGYADRILSTSNKTDGKTADMRVNDFVNTLMESNNNAKDWFNVKAITQGVLSNIDEKKGMVGGFNRDAIKRYLAANKPAIDAHHAKHGIDSANDEKAAENHNRKVATHFRMIVNAKKRESKDG